MLSLSKRFSVEFFKGVLRRLEESLFKALVEFEVLWGLGLRTVWGQGLRGSGQGLRFRVPCFSGLVFLQACRALKKTLCEAHTKRRETVEPPSPTLINIATPHIKHTPNPHRTPYRTPSRTLKCRSCLVGLVQRLWAHEVSWHLASLVLWGVPSKGLFFRVLKIFLRVVPGF